MRSSACPRNRHAEDNNKFSGQGLRYPRKEPRKRKLPQEALKQKSARAPGVQEKERSGKQTRALGRTRPGGGTSKFARTARRRRRQRTRSETAGELLSKQEHHAKYGCQSRTNLSRSRRGEFLTDEHSGGCKGPSQLGKRPRSETRSIRSE